MMSLPQKSEPRVCSPLSLPHVQQFASAVRNSGHVRGWSNASRLLVQRDLKCEHVFLFCGNARSSGFESRVTVVTLKGNVWAERETAGEHSFWLAHE